VYIVLDIYRVAFAITTTKLESNSPTKQNEQWIYSTKVCWYTLLPLGDNRRQRH